MCQLLAPIALRTPTSRVYSEITVRRSVPFAASITANQLPGRRAKTTISSVAGLAVAS